TGWQCTQDWRQTAFWPPPTIVPTSPHTRGFGSPCRVRFAPFLFPVSLKGECAMRKLALAAICIVIPTAATDKSRRKPASEGLDRRSVFPFAIRSFDLVRRRTQLSFVYLVVVCVLDPNLRPLAPAFIRFEYGVAEIVRKYFGDVFFALNFDFPSHMRSPLVRVFTFVSCDSLSRVRAESACHRI